MSSKHTFPKHPQIFLTTIQLLSEFPQPLSQLHRREARPGQEKGREREKCITLVPMQKYTNMIHTLNLSPQSALDFFQLFDVFYPLGTHCMFLHQSKTILHAEISWGLGRKWGQYKYLGTQWILNINFVTSTHFSFCKHHQGTPNR